MSDLEQRPIGRPSRRRSLFVAIAAATLALVGSGVYADQTYILRPTADTVVKQALPNNNFGSSASLSVRHGATGRTEFTFLRFDLPPLAGTITSASLRLRATGTVQQASPYAVTMGVPAWAESSLTWNNWQAGTSFSFLGGVFNINAGSDFVKDVTGSVGPSPMTFGLASSLDVGGQVFSSKEGAVSPTLTVVTDGQLAKCSSPGKLHDELATFFETGNLLYECDYRKNLSANFGSWGGGSENLAVVAAAIALFDGPIIDGTDYRTWWQSFFNLQASTSGTGNVRYFKGSELFSNIYDALTTGGVMAAHYWAHANGNTTVRNLAADYLRRTWFAWSLGTSSVAFDSNHRVQGATRTFVAGADGSCPTLAHASPRSRVHFRGDSKRWLLAKVLGYSQNCSKNGKLKRVVDHVASKYSGYSGLSSADRNALRALVNNTTIPSNVGSVLGAVRMQRDYHFLLWNDGRRATYYLGHQLNNNINFSGGKHTAFTAFFNRSNRDLDVLFVEGKNNVSCADNGGNRIVVDDATSGCSSTHWIPMPLQAPNHHFVLGPNGWRTCTSLSC